VNTLPRSYLFVPGHRGDRFDKVMAAGADAVILDLEDAVPVEAKDGAREAVSRWLHHRERRAGDPQVLVRVNAAPTPQHADDVAACRLGVGPGVDGIVLPKSETPAELAALAHALPGVALLPLVETAQGLAASLELARVHGVQRLVFGSIDFQHDLGIDGDGEELLYARSQLVLHSKLAGVAAPVDGVSTVLEDAPQVLAEAQRARRLGFGAKLCIHPKQIASIHEAFAPTAAQVDWAQRVLAAAEAAQGAAVALDGQMIDRPVILRAQALLARATPNR
jgi:citrate lyase subunit beta / citryl-CoA lyase